ncbi:addiction module toxin RelE [Lelliottia aquatilis]|uniref:Addiction module toxin RelE n=1 Tax=Lelliottia aquatilis TaxID=2080838 RepID=A0ABX5A2L3_9ENTR|nr:addiction module toxin RelE [Lelliottia aquatilis]POZ27058.1 addiction module toxin RelE [Lelliottia sp. 7254-16]POZ23491.1 addiction module toxin RelE [Lelliottia aquatilis]POZ28110.1 addiction module toxin RelE [Lelliottia aquatilis]POZ32829.1 addiction module toxin RelE [Lelliottia aquatilis]
MAEKVLITYTKSFKLHRGGKPVNPRELTLVSDRGEQAQPTKMQME